MSETSRESDDIRSDTHRRAWPASRTIELCSRNAGRTLFRVTDWARPPEIIEWCGRRYVRHTNRQYREAVTLSLYAGYNAEMLSER
jgi:hypothetical protein